MKLLIAFCISITLLAATEGQSKADKKPASPAKTVTIPKDAVETEPGTWRHTDATGKKWIYRKTPFGVARIEDKPPDKEAEVKAEANLDNYKAFDAGDSVRFERKGPFGVYKWKTKKTELDEIERKVWSRTQAGKQEKTSAKQE